MSWLQEYELRGDAPEAVKYHAWYYNSGIVGRTSWMGCPIGKYPSDLLIYAELIYRIRPDVLIETGTNYGGSALFFAHCMDVIGHGAVVTIDPFPRADGQERPRHPRITYQRASSLDAFNDAPWWTTMLMQRSPTRRVMVVLDSIHSMGYVLRELDLYAPLVTPGSYLVVEDTNLNGNPVAAHNGPGPWEAVMTFLRSPLGQLFEVDTECGRFGVTANPAGWLRRKP